MKIGLALGGGGSRGIAHIGVLRKLASAVLDEKSFAELKIPTTLMVVDLCDGIKVALNAGPLLPAVLATTAVPAIFPPVEPGEMQLADGGVLDSLASHVAFEQGADKVIAVDIEPPLQQKTYG